MTENPDIKIPETVLLPILNQGLEGLPEAISSLINHAMLIERQNHLGIARPHERVITRRGRANGFKPRQLDTRNGTLDLRVPQVRACSEPFFPSALERGQRSEKALAIAVAEMYLQGVSTRKVTKVLEKLCGHAVTSTQVSRASGELDKTLEAWRSRPIESPIAHLLVDARYEKVRVAGLVRDCSVLTAVGIRKSDGKRVVLGCSISLSEAEVHWRDFLTNLKERGLASPQTITSDAHQGLTAALRAVFPASSWQRCQFHLQQNARNHVPRKDILSPVASDIRRIFHSDSPESARELLEATVRKYRKNAPQLADWMENNLPEGFTILAWPEQIRKRLRTTSMLENLHKQIRRRTRVASIFPNPESCLRLVSAILMETSDEWESSKAYLNPKLLSQASKTKT